MSKALNRTLWILPAMITLCSLLHAERLAVFNQNGVDTGSPDGPTDTAKVFELCLQLEVPASSATGYVIGGNCSAHCLDFARRFLDGSKAWGIQADSPLEDTLTLLIDLAAAHERGGSERLTEFRSFQAAFNQAEEALKHASPDPEADFIAAIAKLYQLEAVPLGQEQALACVDLGAMLEQLPTGVHLLRLRLLDPQPADDYSAHSMLLLRHQNYLVHMDPNEGLNYGTVQASIADLGRSLAHYQAEWDFARLRLFKLVPVI